MNGINFAVNGGAYCLVSGTIYRSPAKKYRWPKTSWNFRTVDVKYNQHRGKLNNETYSISCAFYQAVDINSPFIALTDVLKDSESQLSTRFTNQRSNIVLWDGIQKRLNRETSTLCFPLRWECKKPFFRSFLNTSQTCHKTKQQTKQRSRYNPGVLSTDITIIRIISYGSEGQLHEISLLILILLCTLYTVNVQAFRSVHPQIFC